MKNLRILWLMLAVLCTAISTNAQYVSGTFQPDSTFTDAESGTIAAVRTFGVEHDMFIQYTLDASVTGSTLGTIYLEKAQSPDGPWVIANNIDATSDATVIVKIEGHGWTHYRVRYAVTGTSTWAFKCHYYGVATDDMSANLITPMDVYRGTDTLTNTETLYVDWQWATFGQHHYMASFNTTLESGAEATQVSLGSRIHPNADWIQASPVNINPGTNQIPALEVNTINEYPFNRWRIDNNSVGVISLIWRFRVLNNREK